MPDMEAWAPWYDLIHQGLPGEAEFYVGQALRSGGPLLEIGCGTGRIALPVAMSGVEVVGLDSSEAMLDACEEKLEALGELPGQVELVLGDMLDFELERRFPLAFMAYRTLMHALEPEEQLCALRCAFDALEPGGRLILNLWAARPELIAPFVGLGAGALQLVGDHRFEDGTGLLHYRATRCEPLEQRLHEQHLLHELDEGGRVLASHALELERAWIGLREMGHLVARAGFEVEALFGDFDCAPVGPENQEMIWVLRRPDAEAKGQG
jgi:SAM-dependent methyltransferase